ncbi:unnamed protein product, partial [Eruca vesicaria subsp. sativa]|nr:unnamed protein product [Eruca vesicaria subsp. sativa]
LQNDTITTDSDENLGMTQVEVNQSAENQHLQTHALIASEREAVLRQLLLLSWGGFLAATSIIISMSEK